MASLLFNPFLKARVIGYKLPGVNSTKRQTWIRFHKCIHKTSTRFECFGGNPFATLDQEGVGSLVKQGVDGGKSTNPDIKLGICGEHGGDPASIKFCHNAGLSYVSCSPNRVPVARLAAAQAAIEAGA